MRARGLESLERRHYRSHRLQSRLPWVVIVLEEVDTRYRELCEEDEETAMLVAAAINLLEEEGPNLGRPLADRIEGSKLHNLKELRPGSTGTSQVRILFIFDPERQAILLTAGDKSDSGLSGTRRTSRSRKRDSSDGLLVTTATRSEGRAMAKAAKWQDVKSDLRAKGNFDDEKVRAHMERLRSEVHVEGDS